MRSSPWSRRRCCSPTASWPPGSGRRPSRRTTGSPKTVTVTLTVDPPRPGAGRRADKPRVHGHRGGASPAAKTVNVTNGGSGTLEADGVGQRDLAGRDAGERHRARARSRRPPSIPGSPLGTYTGTVTVTATPPGATGSPKTVPVTLTVESARRPTSSAPGASTRRRHTAADASGRATPARSPGRRTAPAGKFGGALSFDGVERLGDRRPTPTALDLTTGMTLEAWVNPTAVGSALADGHAQGAARQPHLRAVRRQRRRAAPASDVFTTADIGISGTAALRSTPGPTSPPPTTAPRSGSTSTASRSRRARHRLDPASTGALRIGGNSIWTTSGSPA